jgi:hypothetical protein
MQLDMRRFGNGHLQAIHLSRSSVHWLAAGQRDTTERAAAARLGRVLIDLDLIDALQLHGAPAEQRAIRGLPLGELLVRQDVLAREDLASVLAVKAGQPVDASQ